MRSKTWETRLAAGLAVEVITKNVRIKDDVKVQQPSVLNDEGGGGAKSLTIMYRNSDYVRSKVSAIYLQGRTVEIMWKGPPLYIR